MKLHQIYGTEEDRNNVRTFIPNPDGTVTVWMFIEGTDGDASLNMLDEVMSLDDAINWKQMFLDQGWTEVLEDDTPDEWEVKAIQDRLVYDEDKLARDLELDCVEHLEDGLSFAQEQEDELLACQRQQGGLGDNY